MPIHKFISSVDDNYWLKRLKTELNELTNQNSIRKGYYKTLWIFVAKCVLKINAPCIVLYLFSDFEYLYQIQLYLTEMYIEYVDIGIREFRMII